jgi:hypothetical protein
MALQSGNVAIERREPNDNHLKSKRTQVYNRFFSSGFSYWIQSVADSD